MVKSRIKKIALSILLSSLLLMVMGLPGVAKVIELRFLSLQVGVHSEAGWFADTVAAFNAEYAGRIKIVVDGVSGDSVCWEKLRTDAAAGTMPDLFMLKSDRSEFNVLADSGQVMPLNDYIEADPELQELLNDPVSLTNYTDSEGNILGVPCFKAFVGIYYNTELFEQAGIAAFPTTWSGFFEVCDKLLAAGITPVSLQGAGGNAWCSMLLLADMIGTSGPEGLEWLNTKPEDQNFLAPVFVEAVRKLQIVHNKYTHVDAVGGDYGIAANHFCQGRTAMIANGPWMIGSFSDPGSSIPGLEPKIKYALAPGSGVIAMENIAWGSGSKGKEKQDAAVIALKFLVSQDIYAAYLSLSGQAPCVKVDMSQVVYPRINQEFLPQAVAAGCAYSIIPNAVKPVVIDVIPQFIPGLADLSMTPEEFCHKLQAASDAD